MLRAESLNYSIDNRELIRDISLDFAPGTLYCIVGPNGSGKTTFLKLLTGIWTPTSGRVLWNGQDLLKQPRRTISRTISFVAHHTPVEFDFSVLEVVAMGRYPHPPSTLKDDMIESSLHKVDAWHLRNRRIGQLSHGEKQRIWIARALATESSILLLDEPTTSLDIRHQLEIWQLLRQLIDSGRVIIVTTHDLVAAQRFCDEIAVLHQGRCVATGSFAKTLTPELLETVFGVVLETDNGKSILESMDLAKNR